MDIPLGGILRTCQAWTEGVVDVLQKIIVLLVDWVLIIFAFVAMNKDWNNACDEPLLFYGFMCVVLCFFDLLWELVRCSTESQLDMLQTAFRVDATGPSAQGNAGLLDGVGPDGVGQSEAGDVPGLQAAGNIGSVTGGAIGAEIRNEKATKRKRTMELHFWSIVFSCFVSVVFAFFSSHNEDCAVHMSHLYSYIHTFNYVFILRLGVIMLWICCRAVKNYEDAASAAGAMAQQGMPEQVMQLRTF